MLSFRYQIYYKYCAIIFAVILQILLLIPEADKQAPEIHPEVQSALERVGTHSCRVEILQVAQRLYQNQTQPNGLIRTCHHDLVGPRIHQVGCLTIDSRIKNLTKLDLPVMVQDLTLCLELCFSYGHSHGGLDILKSECYCGDRDESNADCSKSNKINWFRVNNGIHYPAPRQRLQDQQTKKDIKIAFLLALNGRSVLQIGRLLKLIYSQRHVYYIHVDKRRDYLYNELLPLQKDHQNIIVTQSRFNTIWGGPSLLTMILDAIKNLTTRKWDYLINLSESDFPLKSLDELEQFLEANSSDIFLKSHNMKGYKFIRKQGLERTFYQCEDHVWRLGERLLPSGIIYSGGSDWFALTRNFCDFIVDNTVDQSTSDGNLIPTLLSIFNHTLLPAESFFHTVAINSEFCDRFRDENLRLTNWQRKLGCKCQHNHVVDWCGCSPLVYRLNDWARLHRTKSDGNLFFARKFDPTFSVNIINRVENTLVKKLRSADQANDTRHWSNVYHHRDAESSLSRVVFEEMGRLALMAANIEMFYASKLISVDLFFDQDTFVGYILHYCSHEDCIQLLLKKNSSAHLKEYDFECLGRGEQRLLAIEVGHGFDTSERVFRDFSLLHTRSDIVVYHEWLVQRSSNWTNSVSQNKLRFTWLNPSNRIELVQDARLKMSSKLTRLTLAHRLGVRKPIEAGLWRLLVSLGRQRCLNYEFLIVGDQTETSQESFDRFYTVSKICANSSNFNSDCSGWSLSAKQEISATYDLNKD